MTRALPWHRGDLAVTPDGWRAVVVDVHDGVPCSWTETRDEKPLPWPADAVPDLSDVGTAARWLRSCAEVVMADAARSQLAAESEDAAVAVADAYPDSPFSAVHTPALVARAVEATRAYLATLETK